MKKREDPAGEPPAHIIEVVEFFRRCNEMAAYLSPEAKKMALECLYEAHLAMARRAVDSLPPGTKL